MGIWKPLPAGTQFGRLTVLADRQRGDTAVLCRCECGAEVSVKVVNLGRSRNSCGCLKRGAGNGRYSHGMAGTKIYNIWADMVGRCTRPTHMRYADYGGRGITVCERWLDFANFYADMGDRPPGRSLDRRDNDQGYSPENCRWATLSDQARNKRGYGLEGRQRDQTTGRFLPGTSAA